MAYVEPTLPELTTMIAKLEKEQREVREKIEPLQERILQLHKELELRCHQRDMIILETVPKNQLDIEFVVDGKECGSQVMYRHKCDQIEDFLNLRSYGRTPNGQTYFNFGLTKGDPEYIEKVYQGICTVLPYLKPFSDENESIRFDITEKTLSLHKSYHLKIHGNTPDAQSEIVSGRWDHVEHSAPNLKDALTWIEKNLWYENKSKN